MVTAMNHSLGNKPPQRASHLTGGRLKLSSSFLTEVVELPRVSTKIVERLPATGLSDELSILTT